MASRRQITVWLRQMRSIRLIGQAIRTPAVLAGGAPNVRIPLLNDLHRGSRSIHSSILAMLIATGLCLPSIASAGDMTICNRSDKTMEYAMVWDEGIPIYADIWKASGWHRLGPKACVTQLRSSYRQELYLSVRYLTDSGPRLADYGDDINEACDWCDTELLGVETFFCVARTDFERTEGDWSDHQNCPAGYYYQLFNLFALSGPRNNLTIDLE